MALVVKDRVRETSTTTGTGTFTLNGAVTGFQSFLAIGNGNTTYYTIVDAATGDWEVGIGTYSAGVNTLTRTTVLESSNNGNLVDFAAGTKDVFCTYPAEKSVDSETAQTLTNKTLGSGTAISGGTIDGTTIGGSTAAAGSFTTLTTSSTVTHNGGTANGVAYLNGSKVLTTGSALTFDGTRLTSRTGKFGGGAAANSASLMVNNATNTATGIQLFQDGVESWIMGMPANSAGLAWSASNSEQMRLTSTGLGIGTSSPSYKLQVTQDGNLNATSAITNATAGTSSVARFLAISDAGNAVFGMTSSSYTDITGTADSLLIGAGNASGGMSFALDGFLKMKLDSSGNLGLGVTPSAWNGNYKALQVNGTGALWSHSSAGYTTLSDNAYLDANGTQKYLVNGYATKYLQNGGSGTHYWFTAPSGTAGNAISFTQAMTLDASGNLLVGKTSNDGSTPGISMGQFVANVGVIRFVKTANGTYESLQNYHNGTYVGGITYSNTATALATSSDARLKENIVDSQSALPLISATKVRAFNWKTNGERQDYGFVAQELQEVFPEAVLIGGDEQKTMAVDYARLVPVLTKAIQEQQALIESLIARVAQLEGN